jgi:AcrR family transcriptional regulator
MSDDSQTRDRILAAARSTFLQRGTSGARMQEIADEAGVNKALLHYYFRSKERLAEAVFRQEARRLLPGVIRLFASEMPLEEKVRRIVDLYFEVLTDAPALPAYLLAEMHYHPDRLPSFVASVTGGEPGDQAARARAVLARQIEAGVAAGTLRPITPDQLFANVVSLCIFPFAARPMFRIVLRGEAAYREFLEERRASLADFILGALRP